MLHIGIYSGKGGSLLGDYSARAVGAKFSSNRHGFATCSFFIPAALAESFMLYDRPGTPWVYVSENGLSIWEGRMEDPAIENAGVSVTAFGAWRYLSDIPYTATHTSTTAQAIAQALVAAVAAINPALSTNTILIQNPGVTITEQYVDKRPAEILDRLCLLGDNQTPPRVWEACVWEDAMLSFRPRASAGRTWYVDVSAIKLNRTLDSLINRVTAGYQGPANVPMETSAANDTASQGRYNLVRAAKINIQTTDATLAAIIRDLFLADNADPKPATGISFDRVYDATGTPYPLYVVRAGDTLVINNLPLTLSATVDRIRSFVIAEAEYVVDERALNVVLETPTPSLSVFSERLSPTQIGNIVGSGQTAVPPVPDGSTPNYVEIDPATNGASIAGGLNVGTSSDAGVGGVAVSGSSTGSAIFAIDNSSGGTITIANNATATPSGALHNFSGMIIVTDTATDGVVALFLAGGGVLVLVSESAGGVVYSNTSGTAGKINVYYNGSIHVVIENKSGVSRTLRVTMIRTRTT